MHLIESKAFMLAVENIVDSNGLLATIFYTALVRACYQLQSRGFEGNLDQLFGLYERLPRESRVQALQKLHEKNLISPIGVDQFQDTDGSIGIAINWDKVLEICESLAEVK